MVLGDKRVSFLVLFGLDRRVAAAPRFILVSKGADDGVRALLRKTQETNAPSITAAGQVSDANP